MSARHQVFQQRGEECKPDKAEEPAEELAEEQPDECKADKSKEAVPEE